MVRVLAALIAVVSGYFVVARAADGVRTTDQLSHKAPVTVPAGATPDGVSAAQSQKRIHAGEPGSARSKTDK